MTERDVCDFCHLVMGSMAPRVILGKRVLHPHCFEKDRANQTEKQREVKLDHDGRGIVH